MAEHVAKRPTLSRSVRFADANDLEEIFSYDEDASPSTRGMLAAPGAVPDDEADTSGGAARSGGGLFVSLQTVTTTKKRPLFGLPGQSVAPRDPALGRTLPRTTRDVDAGTKRFEPPARQPEYVRPDFFAEPLSDGEEEAAPRAHP